MALPEQWIYTRTAAVLLLLLLFPLLLFGQLKGVVYDAETREPLPHALIISGPNKSLSDLDGVFSVAVDSASGLVPLSISHGFYRDTLLMADAANPLLVFLQPKEVNLQEVEIVASPEKNAAFTEIITLSRRELEEMAAPLGEPDLIRSLQSTPGVLQTGETKSGLFVRGGTNAQTATLMQGVPLFNSAHLLGINSSLDPDAYQSASLLKSGFAAAHDGWLSAYLFTEPRALGVNSSQLKLGLGILSSEVSYQHYLPRYKTGIYSKLKASYYQLMAGLYRQMNKDAEADNTLPDYAFSDFNLQLARQLPKGNLSLLFFASGDGYKARRNLLSLNADWGNRLISARWKQQLGNHSWLELTQGVSQYSFYMQHQRQERDQTSQTSRGYFAHALIKTPLLQAAVLESGAFVQALQVQSLSQKHDAENRLLSSNQLQEQLVTGGVFSQAYLDKGDFSYAAGSRLYVYQRNILWAPRVKMQWNKPLWGSPALFYDRTYQFHHQVNILGVSMPFDFMRLASHVLPVQQADQLGLSLGKEAGRYQLSASLYHRWLKGQLHYPNGTALLKDDGRGFRSHHGRAYGMETEVQADWHRLKLVLGYTLAYSRLAIEQQNNSIRWVYPAQDVRHQLNTSFKYRLGKRWQLTGQWFLQTGSPYTFPVEILPAQGMYPISKHKLVPQFQEYNNVRTPASHRLDLSASFKKENKRGVSEWNFGIYNVYNQANPYFLYFDVMPQQDGSGRITARQKSLLPLTPTIRYTWTIAL